jgi:hypothetical protein
LKILITILLVFLLAFAADSFLDNELQQRYDELLSSLSSGRMGYEETQGSLARSLVDRKITLDEAMEIKGKAVDRLHKENKGLSLMCRLHVSYIVAAVLSFFVFISSRKKQ